MRRGLVLAAGVATLVALPAIGSAAGGGGDGPNKPDLEYAVSKKKTLQPESYGQAKVKCPAGTVVVGGGVRIPDSNTATGVKSSYPFDDGDRNHKPDDGWRGNVESRSLEKKHLLVHAVCSRTGKYRYLSLDDSLGSSSGSINSQPCPGDKGAVGGGIQPPAKEPDVHLAASIPYDDGSDGDSNPDDGWYTSLNNHTDHQINYTTYVICARSGFSNYRYASDASEVVGESQGRLKADCPGKSRPVSGGGELVVSGGTEMAGTFPLADDGWSVRWNNLNSPGDDFVVEMRAICRR